jgi:hypothetical protein
MNYHPLTTQHFVNYERRNLWIRPQSIPTDNPFKTKTPIKHFYLTGQDIVTAVEGTVLRRIVYYDYGEKILKSFKRNPAQRKNCDSWYFIAKFLWKRYLYSYFRLNSCFSKPASN